MDNKKELDRIKSDLKDNIGSKVRFASKKGRKKRAVRNGVIEGTYRNVFVIKFLIHMPTFLQEMLNLPFVNNYFVA